MYHKIHESEKKHTSILGGPALPALGHALAGSTAAAISNVCTYPLDLIITRLQIQRQLRKDAASPHSDEYTSIDDAAYKIYTQEGGLLGFYSGILQDTSKTIADSFLFFLAYNFLRQSRLRSHNASSSHLPVLDELSVGFVAGAFSKLLTTPIANIVTRKQTSSMLSARSSADNTAEPATVRSIARQIHSEKGLQGFWSGYSASLILTLNPSLTFFLYETFKRALLPRSQRMDPPPSATFLLAAVSKAIASTITYPFSLAKARAQASSKTVDTNDEEIKESIEKASDGKVAGTNRGREAARRTVFSTILQIAQNEGVSALYEGLGGEVMKGFFSHGITMILKEAVHKLIIQLYYTILRLLKKYPSPQQVAENAKDQAGQVINGAGSRAQQTMDSVQEGASIAINKGKEVASKGSAQASSVYDATVAGTQQTMNSVQESASTAMNKGKEMASKGSSQASSAYDSTLAGTRQTMNSVKEGASTAMNKGKESVSKGSSQASNAYETTVAGAQQTMDSVKEGSRIAGSKSKEIANAGSAKASSAYDTTVAGTQQTINFAREGASIAGSKTKEIANAGSAKASSTYDTTVAGTQQSIKSAREGASIAGSKTKEIANTGSTKASSAYDTTLANSKSAAASARSKVNDASEQASNTASQVYDKSQETAGKTRANANDTAESVAEYVGKRTEELGRAIRPDGRKEGKGDE